ncbi:hypothetical protein AAAY24_03900 [Faecalibacillus faecis]|uniref:hypothetical protein n=1 Tax=Faecalibacillus faecis TaxID=1982628 RepID=UPI002E76585B|nr:hypothetical protein [Faecalibacillus faecis]MBS5416678.1 hypothetical protein [Coprobacillus sp.]MEE0492644.1 hypothetical protein [Faecalibacillus faecis]
MIILSNIISFLLLAYLAHSFLSPKYNKTKSLLIFVLFFIPLVFITIELKYLFILFLYFIVYFLLYKESFIQKALIIIPFYIIQISFEFLIFHIQTFFNYEIILAALFILFFISIYIYILKNLKRLYSLKYIKFIFIFPILTILWFGDIDCSYFLSTSTTDLFDLLSIPVLNLLLFIITLLTTNYISLKKQKELFNSKYELLQQHYDYNFKFLHDLLHTCNQLNIQFDNQNYENAKEILNQLTQTTYKEFNAIYSQSLVLNYVINNHLQTLIDNNINIKTDIESNSFNNLDYQLQLQLFDYLLTLTIQSCLSCQNDNKIIILKSKSETNYLLLKVVFSSTTINEKKITNHLEKILNANSYTVTIKDIDDCNTSLLIVLKRVDN